MYFKGVIIVAGIVFGVISAAVLFSYDFENNGFYENIDTDSQKAIDIANQFVVSSPTFSFDGIPESLEMEILSTDKEEFRVLIQGKFNTLHSGYGNREKQDLPEDITSHIIEIVIVNGKIISAVIDNKWDELNQITCNTATC